VKRERSFQTHTERERERERVERQVPCYRTHSTLWDRTQKMEKT
jgi:hypothetical protein